jgi:hypothetical protein
MAREQNVAAEGSAPTRWVKVMKKFWHAVFGCVYRTSKCSETPSACEATGSFIMEHTPSASVTPAEREHDLKVWPQFFGPLSDGRKPFEIRKDDRGFHVGDVLHLREWNPVTKEYTGQSIRRRVAYLTDYGQQDGHVVMGLSQPAPSDPLAANDGKGEVCISCGERDGGYEIGTEEHGCIAGPFCASCFDEIEDHYRRYYQSQPSPLAASLRGLRDELEKERAKQHHRATDDMTGGAWAYQHEASGQASAHENVIKKLDALLASVPAQEPDYKALLAEHLIQCPQAHSVARDAALAVPAPQQDKGNYEPAEITKHDLAVLYERLRSEFTCGKGPNGTHPTAGCGKPVNRHEVYRCVDCETPFHRNCLRFSDCYGAKALPSPQTPQAEGSR